MAATKKPAKVVINMEDATFFMMIKGDITVVEQYHSFWTGIAEVVVGSSLIITTSGILGVSESNSWTNTPTIPSLFMYLLTLAVTPANVYMYTHNPVVPRIPVLPYPYGHVGRGLLQCALLGVFYKLTLHSYFDMSMYGWGM